MGNQRFRLSHMIPNAWFYKLRDMNTTTTTAAAATASHNKKGLPSAHSSTSKQQKHPRNSFYYTPRVHQLHTSPPTSRKSLTNRNTIHMPAASPRYAVGSIYTQPAESTHTDEDLFLSPTTDTSNYYESPLSESTQSFDRLPTTSCSCRVISSSATDIKIDFNEKSHAKMIQDSSGFDEIQEIELQKLPPIITKPTKSRKNTSIMVDKTEETCNQSSASIKIVEENISKKETSGRQPVSGVKIRSNSLKTPVGKGIGQGNDHKSFKSQKNGTGSCCIVKSSFDPQKDFKESMVEMIVENNIRAAKDLEKLLACYLSLNSNEHHDMIVKAFEQIWLTFDFVV